MKIKFELEITVAMDVVSPEGTSFYGCLPEGTTYDEIVINLFLSNDVFTHASIVREKVILTTFENRKVNKVFGQPQFGRSPDGKMQSEWVVRINGLLFTIYDFKSRVFPKDNKDWHVGGESKLAAELVQAYFQTRIRE